MSSRPSTCRSSEICTNTVTPRFTADGIEQRHVLSDHAALLEARAPAAGTARPTGRRDRPVRRSVIRAFILQLREDLAVEFVHVRAYTLSTDVGAIILRSSHHGSSNRNAVLHSDQLRSTVASQPSIPVPATLRAPDPVPIPARIRMSARARAQGAVAGRLDDSPRQPSPAQARWPQGGRPPGLVGVGRPRS